MPNKTLHIAKFFSEGIPTIYCDAKNVGPGDAELNENLEPYDDVCALCRSRVPRKTDS